MFKLFEDLSTKGKIILGACLVGALIFGIWLQAAGKYMIASALGL